MLCYLSIIFVFSFLPLFYSFTLVAWERGRENGVNVSRKSRMDGWMDGWRAEGSDSIINQSKQAIHL